MWEGGNVATECGTVDLVNQDPEKSGGFVGGIGLKPRVELDDEGGGNGREQTSLILQSARIHPDSTRNSRRLGLCSNLHHVSSGIPCRIRQPLYGSLCRIRLLEWIIYPFSGYKGV